MKNSIRKLRTRLGELADFSKISIKLGVSFMVCFYIVAIVAYLIAPHAANYFNAMAVYRGSLEAAPACLASGVCAGLLGDLMLKSNAPRK